VVLRAPIVPKETGRWNRQPSPESRLREHERRTPIGRRFAGTERILASRPRERASRIGIGHHGTSQREATAGRFVVDARVVELLVQQRIRQAGSPLGRLAPRELEVLKEMAEGKADAATGLAGFASIRSR